MKVALVVLVQLVRILSAIPSMPSVRRKLTLGEKLYKVVLFFWAVVPLVATYIGVFSAYKTGRIGKVPLSLLLGRWWTTGPGVTLGLHRGLTHKAYKAHPVVKFILLVLGTMAVQGKPIDWACFHLKHHAFADKPGDPHSPHTGEGEGWLETAKDFFHAHMGWFFTGDPADREKYGQRLMEDPIVVFVDKTTYFWVFLSFLIPYLIGGKKGLLWGGFIGMAFVNHATFAVNSVCHTFGSRRFDTDDQSRNNQMIAAITFGEGFHNNHHADPSSPVHGMKGQFDPSSMILRLLENLGLVEINPKLVLTEEKAPIIEQRLERAKARKAQTVS